MHNLKIFVFIALCLVDGLSKAFPGDSKDLKTAVDSKFVISEDAGMPDVRTLIYFFISNI